MPSRVVIVEVFNSKLDSIIFVVTGARKRNVAYVGHGSSHEILLKKIIKPTSFVANSIS